MRTTVRINDELLKRAKKRAADQGRTLTSLIEEGLGLVLTKPEGKPPERLQLPVSKASGGVLPGVDLNRSCDLEEVMNKPCYPLRGKPIRYTDPFGSVAEEDWEVLR